MKKKRKKIEKGRKIKRASAESEKDESLLREQSRRKEITNKDWERERERVWERKENEKGERKSVRMWMNAREGLSFQSGALLEIHWDASDVNSHQKIFWFNS